jgi:Na+/H+-dicarboxylate symporter
LLALVLGVITGVFFGEIVAPLKALGDAFIKLLQITVIPYISVALITGLGILKPSEVKKIAVTGGSILLMLWTASVALVMILPISYPDWPARSLFQQSSIVAGTPPDFLQLYIPSNPFFSLANGIVPAVVVFSVMVGLALTGVKNKDALLVPLTTLAEILSKITSYIAKLAPYGVFALIANTTGTIGLDDLARLQVYIVVAVLMLMILGLWLLPGLVSCLTPLGHFEVLRRLRTPLITAFATGSSLVVLPMLADICKELIIEARERWVFAEDEEDIESSVDVLIPTFYSFPTMGGVMSLGFVLFAGWYIGSPVSLQNYPSLVFGGFASLFGGTALAIPFALSLAELPRELFQLFISTDVIVSRFGTFVSIMHYATIALIGTFALKNLTRLRVWRLVSVLSIGLLLFTAALGGVKAFYTYVVVVPYTKDDYLKSLQHLGEPQQAIVHRTPPDALYESTSPRTLTEIKDSGSLRVCYAAGNYPLSYFNASDELVGFDVEMAHRFAARLELTIEFVPLNRLEGTQKLSSGHCDVVFNSLALDLTRTDVVAHTDPFGSITVAFIVPVSRRDDFLTWSDVRRQGEITIKTAAFQNLSSQIGARIPQAETVRLASFEEQTEYFESGGAETDTFLDTAEEGAAWTILYPRFTVVVPKPVIQLPSVYLVALDNPSVLRAMNEWLLIEKSTGGIDEMYDFWVQGKTQQVQPPRWSVVRDVLGWVD